MKVKSRKGLFALMMALLMALSVGAMGLGAIFNARATAAAPQIDTVLGTEEVLFEDFENAVVSDKDANYKKVSDNIDFYKDNDVSIITEANGNKALKLMFAENIEEGAGKPIAADQRSIAIRKQLIPWKPYRVSFYMKRATNIWSQILMRSGMQSNNYGEARFVSTAGNDSFNEAREDKGVLVTQIIPCDPWGNFVMSIQPQKVINTDTNLGVIIDDLRIQPYEPITDGGGNNILANSTFQAWWNGNNWHFNDPDSDANDWQPSVGAGMNGNWGGVHEIHFSGGFNAYLGTDNQNPTSLKQDVTLKPNTEYNLYVWAKKHGDGFADDDKYSIGITDGAEFTSQVEYTSKMLGQDSYEQYIKLGGVVKTGEATNYTYFIKHTPSATAPMSWRGIQMDEAYLWEKPQRTFLPYADAVKSSNVTEVDNVFSAVAGDKVLQANLYENDATITYTLDNLTADTFYTAAISAQKLSLDSTLSGNTNVKPMKITFTVETALDNSGEVLARMTDDRYLNKAAEDFVLPFNSKSNTTLYMKVKAEAIPTSADPFINSNTVINFKDFALSAKTVESLNIGGNREILKGATADVTTMAVFSDNTIFNASDDAVITSSATNIVSVSGKTMTAVFPGTSTITVTYDGKSASFEVTVPLRADVIDAGADRSIKITETGSLLVSAELNNDTDNADVTADVEVAIADGTIVSYDKTTKMFTALNVGSTLITVSYLGAQDTFTITVPNDVISISAGSIANLPLNATTSLKITATMTNGTIIDISNLPGLTVSSATTANVSVNGIVLTGVAKGTSEITVTYVADATRTVKFTVTVVDIVTTIDAGADRDLSLNGTSKLVVNATYEGVDGEFDEAASAEVVVKDTSVVSYDRDTQTFTALKVGSTLVTVSYGGQTDTFTITVPREIVDLSAIEDIKLSKDGTFDVVVTANYNDDTSDDVSATATITSSATDVVSVAGVKLTALKVGTATISVSFGGETITFVVTVPKELISIEIGEDFTLNKGESKTITVVGTFNDGTSANISAILSPSSNALVISGNKVTAAKAGEIVLTAKYGNLTDTLTVTVPKVLEGISIGDDQNMSKDGKLTVTVVGLYNDDSETILSSDFTIESSDTGVVSVSGAELTAVGFGTATITATYNGKTATMVVTVAKEATEIIVTIGNIHVDGVADITVTVKYNDGSEEVVSDFAASSSDENIAEVVDDQVVGVAAGSATITVKYGKISGTAAIEVLAVEEEGCSGSVTTGSAIAAAILILTLLAVVKRKKQSLI